jgi:hypothetical protein
MATGVVWVASSSTLISEAHHIADPVNNVRGQNTKWAATSSRIFTRNYALNPLRWC